jgi:chaperonin GroEL
MAKVTPKIIYYRDETAQKLIAGINTVANVVKTTLGPRGRNVVLMRDVGYPEVINDGVTIARDINLPDPAMQVGAKLIKAVASKSDSIAGDGTTTSTLMTQVLINKVRPRPPSLPPSLPASLPPSFPPSLPRATK